MADEDYMDTPDSAVVTLGGILGNIFQGLNITTPEAQKYSRQILNQDLGPNSDYGENKVLDQMKSNAAFARAALESAKQRLLAQRNDPAQKYLALGAAFGAPTRSGSFGESMGNVASGLSGYLEKEKTDEATKSKDLLGLDQSLAGVDNSVLGAQLQLANLKRENRGKLDTEALKTIGKTAGSGQNPAIQIPTKAREAVDRAYAKDYVDFIQNGAPDAVKALNDLKTARDTLKGDKSGMLTGPVIGNISNLPLVGKTVQDTFFPKSANTQELVEYTVQRSLRPILGAQFTEREGERLISRVYNPRLDEKTNSARLDKLITQLSRAYDQKVAAAHYFEKNNTLTGFQGKTTWNVDDFMPDEGRGSGGTPRRIKFGDLPDQKPDLNDPVYKGLTPDQIRASNRPAYAEGGTVETVEVEMPDGTVLQNVPEDATKADVQALYAAQKAKSDPVTAPPAIQPTPQSDQQSDPRLAALRESLDPMAGAETAGGAALGSLALKYGVRGAQNVSDLIPGRGITPAQAPVLSALEADQTSPDQLVARLTALRRKGVPATVMDSGTPGTDALAEAALKKPNAQTPSLLRDIASRQSGARGRVAEQVNQALVPDNYFTQEKKLTTDRAASAGPMYDAAYKAFPSVKSEQLFKLMDTPSGKLAVNRAVEAIQDKPGATIGPVDAMGMVQKPSLEFLDQVKKELDDMVKKEEGSGMNYAPTAKGKRIRDLRDAFLTELDNATQVNGQSLYGKAREEWQSGSKLLEALKTGKEDFLKMDPDQLAPVVQGMNAAERENLRTGVAQRLFEMIKNPTSDINSAQKIIGSPGMEDRLSLLFDKPKDFEVFKSALQGEANLYTRNKALMAAGKTGQGAAATLATAPKASLAERLPTIGLESPLKWALKLFSSKSDIPDKALPDVLKLLQSGDQASLTKFAQQLGPKFGRQAARVAMQRKAGKAGVLAGSIAALSKILSDNGEEQSAAQEAP